MKLHIPLILRRFVVLAVLASVTAASTSHADTSNDTWTDGTWSSNETYNGHTYHKFYNAGTEKFQTTLTADAEKSYTLSAPGYSGLYLVKLTIGGNDGVAKGFAQTEKVNLKVFGDVTIHSDSWLQVTNEKSMDVTGHTLTIGDVGQSLLLTQKVSGTTYPAPIYSGVLVFYATGDEHDDATRRTLTVGALETHGGSYVNDLKTFVVKTREADIDNDEDWNAPVTHYATSDKDMDVRHNGTNIEGVDNGYILTDISGNDITIVKGDFSLLTMATPYQFGQVTDDDGNLVDIVYDQDGNVMKPEDMNNDLMNTGDYGYVKSLTIGSGVDGGIEAGTSTVKALNDLQVTNGITIAEGSVLNMDGYALETSSLRGEASNVSRFTVGTFTYLDDDGETILSEEKTADGTYTTGGSKGIALPAEGFRAAVTEVDALAYVQKGEEAGRMDVASSGDGSYTLNNVDADERLTVEAGSFILKQDSPEGQPGDKLELEALELGVGTQGDTPEQAEADACIATVKAAQDITVGQLTCHANTELDMDGKSLTVEGDAELEAGSNITGDVTIASGLLNDNGSINGDVTVQSGARMEGSGTSGGLVTVEGGAHLHIGNSPGYRNFTQGLSLNDGATISFSVDGATPAAGANAAGCHSYATVTGGVLTLATGSTAIAQVDIMGGIIAAGYAPFTLTLLEVDPAAVNGDGQFTLELTGQTDLLLASATSLEWNAASGKLIFRSRLCPDNVDARATASGAAFANALWSSTSAVRAFARTATSQLSAPVVTGNGVTVWGSAIGDYVTMSGFRSNAHGYAVGADKQWTPRFRSGISFGQLFGDYTADRGLAEVEQNSMMLGLYGEYDRELNKRHGVSVTGYAAYGRVENDADTRVLGLAELPGQASWDDDVFVAGFRAHWNMRVTNRTTLSPFIGLEYQRGEQSDFCERYEGDSNTYTGSTLQVWRLPVGMTATTELELRNGQKLLPWLTVGYVGDISRQNPRMSGRVLGQAYRYEGANPGRHGFMLNAGSNWQISESWSAGASYKLETRSHETSHEGNFSVRYSF